MNEDRPILAIDVETVCNVSECKGYKKSDGTCKHPLDYNKNLITVIGFVGDGQKRVFRDIDDFSTFMAFYSNPILVGHNFKFDIKCLWSHGVNMTFYDWQDTQCMASVLEQKVPKPYKEWYEQERMLRNKSLPHGVSHRKAGTHSLKLLAPYFLNVEPFWEDPSDHDNDTYVLKDCSYTLQLYDLFMSLLENEGTYDFYSNKLMVWNKMLLGAELKGICLDTKLLEEEDKRVNQNLVEVKQKLDNMWQHYYDIIYDNKIKVLKEDYNNKTNTRIEKLKNKSNAGQTIKRYNDLYEKAKAKIDKKVDLNSAKQLSELFKEHLKLNIKTFSGEESTNKEVLQRLSSEGREDIKLFLEYRKYEKLSNSFFPSYKEFCHKGLIHSSFNPTGTRTGRLSSSLPNLQQVPHELHKLFKARPGYKLATYDYSAIEPRLLAYYTQDVELYDIINNGDDFHGHTTKTLCYLDCHPNEVKENYPKERKLGKELGLLLFYGGGWRRIKISAMKHGFNWSDESCKERYKVFKEKYERVFQFRDTLNGALQCGKIPNILGRPIVIPDKDDIHLKGLNTLCQGSASDLVQEAAHRINQALRASQIDGQVLLLVHDEIITEFDSKKEESAMDIIKKCMTGFKLTNDLGNIKLEVEGKVSQFWEK